MRENARGYDRVRQAYKDEGPAGALKVMVQYLKWRIRPQRRHASQSATVNIASRAEAIAEVAALRDWYSTFRPQVSPLVSVILPTRGRRDLLKRAVQSVLSQIYTNWELLIIDDSKDGDASLEGIEDGRIRWLRSNAAGVASARNLGLDEARGEIVAYLDDDNLMDPVWLQAVVVSFEYSPEASVGVGAQVVAPEANSGDRLAIRMTTSFDWDELSKYNYIDMGMLAHRSEIHVRFDESLNAFVDWDYVVRITLSEEPMMIRAMSGTYLTDAKGRVSYQDRADLANQLRTRFRGLQREKAHSKIGVLDSFSAADIPVAAAAIRRLGDRTEFPSILLLGYSDALDLLADDLDDTHVEVSRSSVPGVVLEGSRYDLVVVDGQPNTAVDEMLEDQGLLLGLNAHRHHYETRFKFSRRVSDTLWLAARSGAPDLESLFDGVSLVKLGVPHADDVG